MIKLPRKSKAEGINHEQHLRAGDNGARDRYRRTMQRFYTVKQLALRWAVSERQIHRFIQADELPAHRFGRSVRIAENDVLLFELQSR